MILFVFNDYFPTITGFGTRCHREIKALIQLDDVEILCRGKISDPSRIIHKIGDSSVVIHHFVLSPPTNEPHKIWIFSGIHELYRNIWLLLVVGFKIFSIFWEKRFTKISLYVVSSPLFLAFIVSNVARIFTNVESKLIGIHDLEPEMAKHIKNLNDSSFLMRIEYFLEKFLCRYFRYTLVTSKMQAITISRRCSIDLERVWVIPNAEPYYPNLDLSESENARQSLGLTKGDWVLAYTSAITYRYTYEGLVEFFEQINTIQKKIPSFKILIIGGGFSLNTLKSIAKKHGDSVLFTDYVNDIYPYLSICNAGIIPWKEDYMTRTQLPTKLFAYMQAKLPVIAPNWGEFAITLENYKNAMLFDSINEISNHCIHLYSDKKLSSKLIEHSKQLYEKEYTEQATIKKLQSLWKA